MSDGNDFNQEAAQRAWDARQAAEAAARQMTSSDATVDPNYNADAIELNPEAEPLDAPTTTEPGVPTTGEVPSQAPPVPQLTEAQAQAVNDFQNQVQGNVKASQNQFANPESITSVPEGAGFLPRSQARQNTEAARNQGTEIYLKKTGSKAIVRDLPFTDYVMVSGIPSHLRSEIDASFRDKNIQQVAQTGTANVQGLNDAYNMWEKGLQMANAICIAAFVMPRLVLTEAELDESDPMTWLVTDIDPSDRLEVMAFVNRDRTKKAMEGGGAVAVAGFPG